MPNCSRCTKCCYLDVDGKLVKCKYLVKFGKRGHCRIYKDRLGTDLGHGHRCIMREDCKWDYPGCSMNTGKPIHPLWR